jgi:polyhydroxyalkanoate synthase
LQARSGTPVKPPRMGVGAYKPVGDAPGTYVLQK